MGILQAGFYLIKPSVRDAAPEDLDAWCLMHDRFCQLLEVNTEPAFIGAALMLVPEGWLLDFMSDLGAGGGGCVELHNPGTGENVVEDRGARCLSLAILAAVLAAQTPVSITDIGDDEEVGR